MAALVRHDASAEAVLPPAGAKTGADAVEIARLYDDLDRVNERDNPRGVVRESADLVYHLVVLWHDCGVTPDEVWTEMHRRADKLGIAEKLPKSAGRHAAAEFGE